MKPQQLLISSLAILMLAAFAADGFGQGRRGAPGIYRPAPVHPYSPTDRTGVTPFDVRPLFQLESLTEEQRNKILELQRQHRTRVSHLSNLLRNGRITSEEFSERRTHLFEQHQEDIRQVLTEDQWKRLESLRMETFIERRDLVSGEQEQRMRLTGEELGLDETTILKLQEVARKHHQQLANMREPMAQRGWTRDIDFRKEMLRMQMSMQDEVRELLDEETYLEWRMLWQGRAGYRTRGAILQSDRPRGPVVYPRSGRHYPPGMIPGRRHGMW